MKFTDMHVFRDEKFSVGIEEVGKKYYISIPVSNPYVDYEEYYEINDAQFHACPANIEELKEIAAKCRARQNDSRLIMKPGRLRGHPI